MSMPPSRFFAWHSLPKVYFVFARDYQFTASTVMRGQQLADIVATAFKGRYRVNYVPFQTTFRNSILFLTKGAITLATPEQLQTLTDRGNKIIFDPADAQLPADKVRYADVLVAMSLTAKVAYNESFPGKDVALINHHVDPRIKPVSTEHREFRVGYFGELVNTIITPKIERVVDFISVNTAQQDVAWFERTSPYAMHYAIRNERSIDAFKPFLKGFTAAYCNANILIQNTEEEAVRWLGEDYPYLLKGPVTENNILKHLEKARKSFGTDEWRRGLQTMERIKATINNGAISKQVGEVLDKLARL